MKLGTRVIISFLVSIILGIIILFVLGSDNADLKTQDLAIIAGSVFIVSFVLLSMFLSKYFGEPVIPLILNRPVRFTDDFFLN